MIRRVLASVALFGLMTSAALASSRPVVVELFTSQGCSDCPPADALLRHVKATDPDILALDLHVTYWDNAAWRDPFSLQAATELQEHYASLGGGTEVYTPEAVVDGKAQFVGSDAATMAAAIGRAKGAIARSDATPVAVEAVNGRVSVHVGAGKGTGAVWLFGFDPERITPVRGGESGGVTMTEVNVVRSITRLDTWRGAVIGARDPGPGGDEVCRPCAAF